MGGRITPELTHVERDHWGHLKSCLSYIMPYLAERRVTGEEGEREEGKRREVESSKIKG